MERDEAAEQRNTRSTLERTYRDEKPKFMKRLRAAGRTFEEAEDLLHDVYAESVEKLSVLSRVSNVGGWLNRLLGRRLIDLWRHDQVRKASGELDVGEETVREIISETGLNPLDEFVRESLTDALNAAIRALPTEQRKVIEAQVFGGKTFRALAEESGESIDTLAARKRYAIANLTRALRNWIET
jgi:RNA polymerase sigma factor (sigma-70 family)